MKRRGFVDVEVIIFFTIIFVFLFVTIGAGIFAIMSIPGPIEKDKVTIAQPDFDISEWTQISRYIHYGIVKVENRRYLIFNKIGNSGDIEVFELEPVKAENE